MNISQSWLRNKPIFFAGGKRVSLEVGYNLFLANSFLQAPHLKVWFSENINHRPVHSSEFYIMDDFDKPFSERVTQKIKPNVARYIHPKNRHWQELIIFDEATSLEKFGVDVVVKDDTAYFKQERPSQATYRNGEPRDWQGEKEFSLPVWVCI